MRKRQFALLLAAATGGAGLPVAAHAAPPGPRIVTVRNTNDTGQYSLREAIDTVNAMVPKPTVVSRARIEFEIFGTGTKTITPATDLPAITVPVAIDGYTQPGAAAATSTTPATLAIVIDAKATTRGLELRTDDASVSGLVIRSAAQVSFGAPCASDGICVLGDRNVVWGNVVGMGYGGVSPLGNKGDGIDVQGDHNVIGGTTPGARNLISANGYDGVRLYGDGNKVENNVIGLDVNGTGDFGNGGDGVSAQGDDNVIGVAGAGNVIANNATGVVLSGDRNSARANLVGTDGAGTARRANSAGGLVVTGPDNVIGGAAEGEGNVVSGNVGDGIAIMADPGVEESLGTVVQGNLVGTAIDGTTRLANTDDGVTVQGDDNLIGGTATGAGNVISGNRGDGVEVSDAVNVTTTGNRIEGNLIGTAIDGTTRRPNDGNGVSVQALGANHVGGTEPGAGNVISGNNGNGVDLLRTTGTTVEANAIGTDRGGRKRVPNALAGVAIAGDGSVIGGAQRGAGNIIGANGGDGLTIAGSDNTVLGNGIGTDLGGTAAMGNTGSGVNITGGSGNRIGTEDEAVTQNLIAHNGQDGVTVAAAGGVDPTDNAIVRNAIFDNGDLGIDLGLGGVNGIDPGDTDAGANDSQNFPVIGTASTADVTWDLDTQPGTYRIEFFAGRTCSASGNGEGALFLGAAEVTTASGFIDDQYTFLTRPAPAGYFLTMTATVVRTAPAVGPTSEFSACARV